MNTYIVVDDQSKIKCELVSDYGYRALQFARSVHAGFCGYHIKNNDPANNQPDYKEIKLEV